MRNFGEAVRNMKEAFSKLVVDTKVLLVIDEVQIAQQASLLIELSGNVYNWMCRYPNLQVYLCGKGAALTSQSISNNITSPIDPVVIMLNPLIIEHIRQILNAANYFPDDAALLKVYNLTHGLPYLLRKFVARLLNDIFNHHMTFDDACERTIVAFTTDKEVNHLLGLNLKKGDKVDYLNTVYNILYTGILGIGLNSKCTLDTARMGADVGIFGEKVALEDLIATIGLNFTKKDDIIYVTVPDPFFFFPSYTDKLKVIVDRNSQQGMNELFKRDSGDALEKTMRKVLLGLLFSSYLSIDGNLGQFNEALARTPLNNIVVNTKFYVSKILGVNSAKNNTSTHNEELRELVSNFDYKSSDGGGNIKKVLLDGIADYPYKQSHASYFVDMVRTIKHVTLLEPISKTNYAFDKAIYFPPVLSNDEKVIQKALLWLIQDKNHEKDLSENMCSLIEEKYNKLYDNLKACDPDMEIFCSCINPNKNGYSDDNSVYYVSFDSILRDNIAIIDYVRNPVKDRLVKVPSELHLESEEESIIERVFNDFKNTYQDDWDAMDFETKRKYVNEEIERRAANLTKEINDAYANLANLTGAVADDYKKQYIQPLLDKM